MKKHKHKLVTFSVLMAASTVAIHFINRTVSATAQLKQLLDNSSPRHFHWRFGDIYYTKKGSGNPVLLIHDTLPGASGYEWNRIENALAAEHTVYTVDLPGCGRSEKSGTTYTNFVYVQMICDFIRKVIGQKTDVIASGFSGSFAVMACHNERELFNRIMLINPPQLTKLQQMPGKKDHLLKLALEIPVFGTLVYHMIVSHENVNNLFIERMYYNPFHADADISDAYYESAHKNSCYAKFLYSSIVSRYININIRHALKSLDNSIYIVEGETEPGCKSVLEEYTSVNPAIETVVLKHTKHIPHIEDPEAFLEQVGIFF